MRSPLRTLVLLSLSLVFVATAGISHAGGAARPGLTLSEFRVDQDAWCEVQRQWTNQLLATHEAGTWAPMEFSPTDAQLATLGLPSRAILRSRDYPTPTLVTRDGRFYDVPVSALEAAMTGKPPKDGGGKGGGDGSGSGGGSSNPSVAAYGGTGCLGIRPGAWLLLLDGGIGWCSMAHVYGSPGSYDISTAGHCGNTGDTATVIAALGNRGDATGVVLLDFGTFAQSRDGGLGNDWALIDIKPEYQSLVTPTMCFWGGPRGTYTATGDVAAMSFSGNSLIPNVSVNPNPRLAQAVLHYGHGAAIGAGGTPRAGAAIAWRQTHFMFFGALAPGDSGSGSNAAPGDGSALTDFNEAAGINTHIWVDPLMRSGFGIMGGTRATQVGGAVANGQLVGYPAPVPILP